jgi:hypothetical protein
MAQVVQHLPNKLKALTLNPNTTKTKQTHKNLPKCDEKNQSADPRSSKHHK